ncbi:glycosyltransferase [Niabella yanshanensis]|uniref:Glycosyltransferase n=1 Tax=Niabella yanshanensis TaxID=577386 RepID=A0ABZ0W762_9BACT|nr:glycosyltransferase [Niabella yanshanensis]WQD39097.1 glycosyltransferase [Niabella yanshanensis]
MTVSISCITYNHAPYIRQCLDGFMIQQCSFDFEVLIHDDASTDGTSDIIREYQQKYPDIIKPIIQAENQYSKGVRGINIKYNFPRAKGKYIALCEGDDYWTDPLKLQKQVDFLEKNNDYSVITGGYIALNVTKTQRNTMILSSIVAKNQEDDKGFTFTLLDSSKAWITKTLTSLFRNIPEICVLVDKYSYGRDVHLFYELLKIGKGYYLKEALGVYNIHNGGVFSLKSLKEKSITAYNLYKELYEKSPDEFTRIMYFKSGLSLLKNKLSLKIKDHRVDTFFLLKTSMKLAKTRSEKIGIFKSLIPIQITKTLKRKNDLSS